MVRFLLNKKDILYFLTYLCNRKRRTDMTKETNRIAIMAGERRITFSQMYGYINLFAQHTPQKQGAKTIIFAENREGWIYSFFSVWKNKGLAVPVDASSTVADLTYILKDCTPSCIWTTESHLEVAQKAAIEAGVELEILLIEDYENVSLPMQEEVEQGWLQEIFSSDNKKAALIIYTSGTTGSPKGVVLSFANLYANVYSVSQDVPIFNTQRRTIILLPLHHVLPLMGTVVIPIVVGGGVAICPSMSGPDIMKTLAEGEIAIFIGVPRLWHTLYAGIKKKIDASAAGRMMFSLATKMNSYAFSRKVFATVHKALGGHIAYFVSGGAALDTEVSRGLKTLGISVLEGYGMTETAPMISFTRPGDILPGCVGKPLSMMDVKIINGEICAKGPNVMLGYYNRPEETAAVIDKDGYVHTGDLGFIDEQGRIHITGRSKEIIVLSNGKNVQPNEIEFMLEKYSDKVKEVAVTQDGDLLKAIIVPQEEWARDISDDEAEEQLKRTVIEPYNLTVENYKKIKSILVYRGELPRTKMEKLQRFKLKDIIAGASTVAGQQEVVVDEVQTEEYRILSNYIETEKKVKVKPTDHLETDLAFDSLDNVSMQGFIEQTFGIEMKADTLASYNNIKALAEHIARVKTRIEVENTDWHSIVTGNSTSLQLPSTSWMFTRYAGMFRSFLLSHNNMEIRGTENLAAVEQFILAPNHQSYIDGPIAVSGLDNESLRNTYFYATEEHVKDPLRKYMARNNNVILMEQKNLKNSILKLAEVLKQGKNIVIFPEGTRTRDGQMQAFKKTFAILAKELNVPIIPVRISGAYEAMPRGRKFPGKDKITVEYLTPVTVGKDESYEELTERVRSAIAG